ncbi:MAG: hypothetical protein LBE78_00535 [Burkholderiaceae bacterium]|jgi:hypothetical protein|nr:hypothetical protein [Burkholderiaceae bacterium]
MAFSFSHHFPLSSPTAFTIPSYLRRRGALKAAPRPPARPQALRVVHGHEGTRLTIAGRLADVCAELERLAAREARGARRQEPVQPRNCG